MHALTLGLPPDPRGHGQWRADRTKWRAHACVGGKGALGASGLHHRYVVCELKCLMNSNFQNSEVGMV